MSKLDAGKPQLDYQFTGHPERLYGACVAYLLKAGWRREELGSGWWWCEGFEEAPFGVALDAQLNSEGIDFREGVSGEPEEFWG